MSTYGTLNRHSRVVQRHIDDIEDFSRAFEDRTNGEIPIVLTPSPAGCLWFKLSIPSGPYVFHQRFNKHEGMLSPGLQVCWPAWNRVSHLVSPQAITYFAPASQVPTADNVMVNIDLSVSFKIANEDAAKNFVFKLGAHRFDGYLTAKVEEAVRGLVRSVTHDRVNDLREEFAQGMLANLNLRCKEYGITIMTVKITDVQLPPDLQDRLERTTAFKTKIEEQEKTHENRVRVLNDDAEQKLTAILKGNSRKIQEIEAEIQRFEIERAEMEDAARGRAQVQEVNALSRQEVEVTRARGEVEVSRTRGEQEAEELIKRTTVECNRRKRKAEEEAQTMILASRAKLAAARNLADAMLAQAEAEEKAAEHLAEKRAFELEWERLDVLRSIAGTGRKLISGQQGEQILRELVPHEEAFREQG